MYKKLTHKILDIQVVDTYIGIAHCESSEQDSARPVPVELTMTAPTRRAQQIVIDDYNKNKKYHYLPGKSRDLAVAGGVGAVEHVLRVAHALLARLVLATECGRVLECLQTAVRCCSTSHRYRHGQQTL